MYSVYQCKDGLSIGVIHYRDYDALFDFPAKIGYPGAMKKNDVDFDKPLPMYIFQSCISCGKFIRTKDKARLILFMYDHYGEDRLKRCSKTWYGEFVYTLLNWRYRNV